MTDVTCIGLGLMGSALARAVLAAGHRVVVWNRTPRKTQALAELGAAVAASLADAVAASPIVMICIDNYASTRALLETEGLARHLPGRIIVNLTTGTPREAEAMSAWAGAQGAQYLDGAILAGPHSVGTPAGELLFSGDEASWEVADPLLACLAGKVRFVGPRVGDAAALDLAWLTISYVKFIGVAHAAGICRAQGIDLQAFIDLFPADPYTCKLAGFIRDEAYDRPTATLQVWGEALAHIQMQARDAGIPSAVPDFVAGYFHRAMAMGLGQQEAIAIYKTLLVKEKD